MSWQQIPYIEALFYETLCTLFSVKVFRQLLPATHPGPRADAGDVIAESLMYCIYVLFFLQEGKDERERGQGGEQP